MKYYVVDDTQFEITDERHDHLVDSGALVPVGHGEGGEFELSGAHVFTKEEVVELLKGSE